jgi:DNA topoisomerase-1
MAKNLLIVESPAKTKTLKKFLGRQYAVEASVGHVRDLIKKDMGIGPDYEPRYEVLAAKKDVVKKLRQAAKEAETVYLAPDPDREGEAIAWHIAEILKDAKDIRRVTFNEITQRAVLKALDNPRTIDLKKVDAQQARRVLDRMMGFRLSPLLWEKVKQGLSAGRVQSVALKMVCDRQAEIDAFVSEEYWNLGADLKAALPPQFNARLSRIEGRKAEVHNGEEAGRIVRSLESGRFVVGKVERKESRQRPAPPFITSRLQQEAARRYGFSVKRTMGLAQGLYEGREIGGRGSVGLITYMRTDSTRVAEEALTGGREYIGVTYGAEALPEKPNVYSSKEGAQDAHEAIRPTSFDLPPDAVRDFLKDDEWKLYKLIWDRFVASQMLPALFDVTQVDIENGPYVLRASGKILKRPGFLAVYRETPDEDAAADDSQDGAMLPALREGETLELVKVLSEQKFTQPPAQYSEATLVKALEENGIGRPSTYATILSVLTDRDYVERLEGRFRPTQLGRAGQRHAPEGVSRHPQRGVHGGPGGAARRDRGGEGRVETRRRGLRPEVLEGPGDRRRADAQRQEGGHPARREVPRVRLRAADALRPLRAVHRLQQLPGLQVHPQRRRGAPLREPRRGRRRGGDPSLRDLRQADGAQAQPLRHLLRLHRLPGVQGHPQDRSEAGGAGSDRRSLPGVRQGGDRREALPPGQDLLVLQPLPGLQVLPLEEAGRPRLPAVRRPLPPGEGHQAARHPVRLQYRGLRLRRGRRRAGGSLRDSLKTLSVRFARQSAR